MLDKVQKLHCTANILSHINECYILPRLFKDNKSSDKERGNNMFRGTV